MTRKSPFTWMPLFRDGRASISRPVPPEALIRALVAGKHDAIIDEMKAGTVPLTRRRLALLNALMAPLMSPSTPTANTRNA